MTKGVSCVSTMTIGGPDPRILLREGSKESMHDMLLQRNKLKS